MGREVTTKKACRSNYKGTDYFFLRKQISLQGFFSRIPLSPNWEMGINHANAVASCIRHLPNFQVVMQSLTKGLKRLATRSLILEAQAECQWLRDFVEPWTNWFQTLTRQYLQSIWGQFNKLLTGATMEAI